jgi:DNA-binding GntR family transcriptional regulator
VSSLADQAYLALRDRLVTLAIPPGAPIDDDALSGELGLGRTPLREALKRLEGEHLVVAYPRRGTFATEVQLTDLAHVSEVRQVLEPLAAAAAARRRTAIDHDALTRLSGQLRRARDRSPVALIEHDMQIHRAIYRATHNPHLEATLTRYDNLATRIWCLFADRLDNLAGHVDEHAPLIAAVLDGDDARAAELAAQHVARFDQAIRALV